MATENVVNRVSNKAAEQNTRRGRTSLVVGDIATREDERGGLLVERRKLGLESKVHRAVTSDVARSTSAGTVGVESLAAREREGSGLDRKREQERSVRTGWP